MMYVCVHCMKERGNGCRCVSPFADNAVLAAMRDDREFCDALDRIRLRIAGITDSMFLLEDAFSRVFESYRENIFDRDDHRGDALTYYGLRKRQISLRHDPGDSPKIDTGKLMSSFHVNRSMPYSRTPHVETIGEKMLKITAPLGSLGYHAVRVACERDHDDRIRSVFQQDHKVVFGHFEEFDFVPTISGEELNEMGIRKLRWYERLFYSLRDLLNIGMWRERFYIWRLLRSMDESDGECDG